jgi:hypothetical protein
MALVVLNVAAAHDAQRYRFPGSAIDNALVETGLFDTIESANEQRSRAIQYYRLELKNDVFTYDEATDTFGLSEDLVSAWSYIQSRTEAAWHIIANSRPRPTANPALAWLPAGSLASRLLPRGLVPD